MRPQRVGGGGCAADPACCDGRFPERRVDNEYRSTAAFSAELLEPVLGVLNQTGGF